MTEYFNSWEAAEYLRRCVGAIRVLVLRRKIPFRKVAGRLLFLKSELDRWIQTSEGVTLEEIEGNGSH